MNELERLFHLIVTNLAATEPARLHHPIAVSELPRTVVPYRTSRRHLGVVTTEEYEHLLLRLVAGEGGYADTEPADALAKFRVELATSNPDLGVLSSEGAATILLAAQQVAFVLGGRTERSFAPPEPEPLLEPDPAPAPELEPQPTADLVPEQAESEPEAEWESQAPAGETCGFCGGSLPAGRVVSFCPHCGQHLRALRCPRCQAEVEFGWRHCIACGTALGDHG